MTQGLPREVVALVAKWKRCGYEPHLVRLTVDKEYDFIVRMLTRQEYSELVEKLDLATYYSSPPPPIVQNLGSLHLQEIIKTALLWPATLGDDLPASIDRLLADAIVAVSGWVDPETLVRGLNQARTYANSLQGFLESRILAVFPEMGTAGINELNFNKFMKLVGLSESITGQQIDLRPWLDPESYRREIEKAEKKVKKNRQAELDNMLTKAGKNPAARKAAFDQYLQLLAQESTSDLGKRGDKPDFDKHNQAIISI